MYQQLRADQTHKTIDSTYPCLEWIHRNQQRHSDVYLRRRILRVTLSHACLCQINLNMDFGSELLFLFATFKLEISSSRWLRSPPWRYATYLLHRIPQHGINLGTADFGHHHCTLILWLEIQMVQIFRSSHKNKHIPSYSQARTVRLHDPLLFKIHRWPTWFV